MICNWSALRGSLLRRRHFSVLGGAGPRLIMVVFTSFSLTCARPGRVEARLPFRWPQQETGKTAAFAIPVASG
jgi:hypothetical protein